jgi:hypothetical protein
MAEVCRASLGILPSVFWFSTRQKEFLPSVISSPSVLEEALGKNTVRRVPEGKHLANTFALSNFGVSHSMCFLTSSYRIIHNNVL